MKVEKIEHRAAIEKAVEQIAQRTAQYKTETGRRGRCTCPPSQECDRDGYRHQQRDKKIKFNSAVWSEQAEGYSTIENRTEIRQSRDQNAPCGAGSP